MNYHFYDYKSMHIVWFHMYINFASFWFVNRQLQSLLIKVTGISEISKAIGFSINKLVGDQATEIFLRGVGGNTSGATNAKGSRGEYLKKCVFFQILKKCLYREEAKAMDTPPPFCLLMPKIMISVEKRNDWFEKNTHNEKAKVNTDIHVIHILNRCNVKSKEINC